MTEQIKKDYVIQHREEETGSPDRKKWEIGWQAPDNMLKITVFDREKAQSRRKGASEYLRQKVLRMDAAMSSAEVQKKNRLGQISWRKRSSEKHIGLFRRVVKTVMLLLRCFRMRQKIAIQSDDLTFTHHEKAVGLSSPDRSSLSLELIMFFSTPPKLRKSEDIRKVVSFLRAWGVVRAMLGQSITENDENLARVASYERYQNGRIVAQQGRSPDRFYFIMAGKILVVKEIHVSNSVISKTVSVLTKGSTTSVEEMENESQRQRSLICRGIVEVIVVDKHDFFAMRSSKSDGAKDFLSKHPLFCLFPMHLLTNSSTQLQYYPAGSVVFSSGKEYEWIYIVKSGECSMVRSQLVTDVFRQKQPLFNKQTPEGLGCDRGGKVQSIPMPLAGFRVWKRTLNKPTLQSKRYLSVEKNMYASNEKDSYAEHQSFQAMSSSKKMEHPLKAAPYPSMPAPVNQRKTVLRLRQPNPRYAAQSSVSQSTATDEDRFPSGLMLSSSRFSGSVSRRPQTSDRQTRLNQHSRMINSAPPALRRAHLELGRLKAGDSFGLDDLFGGTENVTSIALISNGADVVKVKRKFFLKHAPTNLLMKLSGVNHDFPSVAESRACLEASETWTMYKNALLRLLTSHRKSPISAKNPWSNVEEHKRLDPVKQHAAFPDFSHLTRKMQKSQLQDKEGSFTVTADARHSASVPSMAKLSRSSLNNRLNPRLATLKAGERW